MATVTIINLYDEPKTIEGQLTQVAMNDSSLLSFDDRSNSLYGKRLVELLLFLRMRGPNPVVLGLSSPIIEFLLTDHPAYNTMVDVSVDFHLSTPMVDGLPEKTHYQVGIRRSGGMPYESVTADTLEAAALAIERAFGSTQ